MTVTDRHGTHWSIHIWHAPRNRDYEAMSKKEKREHKDLRPLTIAKLHMGDCGAKRGVPCNADTNDVFIGETRQGERDFYKPQTGAKVALARAMQKAGLGPYPADHAENLEKRRAGGGGVERRLRGGAAITKSEEIRKDLWDGYVKAAHLLRTVPEYEIQSFTTRAEGTTDGKRSHYIGPFDTPELAEIAIRKLQRRR